MAEPRSRRNNPEHRAKFSTLELHPELHAASMAMAARYGISWACYVRFLLSRDLRLSGMSFSAFGWPLSDVQKLETESEAARAQIIETATALTDAHHQIQRLCGGLAVRDVLRQLANGLIAMGLPETRAAAHTLERLGMLLHDVFALQQRLAEAEARRFALIGQRYQIAGVDVVPPRSRKAASPEVATA